MSTTTELIGLLIRHRDEVLRLEHAAQRQEEAAGIVQDGLLILKQILGDEILIAFLGDVDPGDPRDVLEAIRSRCWSIGALFAKLPQDKASFWEIAGEAHAIAEGDAPVIFAQLPGVRKKPSRLTKAKLGAICWDVYLEQLGIEGVSRHADIAKAYGTDWGTIFKWKAQALELFGQSYLDYRLWVARSAGEARSCLTDYMEAGATWQEALERDGDEFRIVQRVNRKNT
jgi:hypothetical protein